MSTNLRVHTLKQDPDVCTEPCVDTHAAWHRHTYSFTGWLLFISSRGVAPLGVWEPAPGPLSCLFHSQGLPSAPQRKEAHSTVSAMLGSSRNWVMSLGTCGPSPGSTSTPASW